MISRYVSPRRRAACRTDETNQQRWLTVAASPITLILLVFGYIAAKKEKRGLMWVFLFGSLVGLGYFIFKVRSSFFLFFRFVRFGVVDADGVGTAV